MANDMDPMVAADVEIAAAHMAADPYGDIAPVDSPFAGPNPAWIFEDEDIDDPRDID